jgi:cytidine deaminase
VTDADLIAAATAARDRAFAPFSKFLVGAALLAEDGTVFTGCNVESASYGLTICAERVAIVKGVSEGRTRFTRVAVVADTDDPTPPCGACRQLLWEFAPDAEVTLSNLTGATKRYTMRQLLPDAFDATRLGEPRQS